MHQHGTVTHFFINRAALHRNNSLSPVRWHLHHEAFSDSLGRQTHSEQEILINSLQEVLPMHASMILWPTCLQKSAYECDCSNDSAWEWAGVSCSAKATADQSYYGIFLMKVLPWGKNSILYLKIKYNLWSICKFIQYRQNIFSPLPNCTLFKFTIWTSTSCIVKSEKITINREVIVLSTATWTLNKYYCIIKSAGNKIPQWVFSYLVLFITRTRNHTKPV